MRVRLDSIGCRLNIDEMEELAHTLAAHGHRIVGPGDDADLFVFNTCAVTHVAARKSRKILRQIRRDHPGASIVATGCYVDLAAAEVERLGVDMVVANRDKDGLAALLAEAGVLRDADPLDDVESTPFASGQGRTRAFVKVQDGCNNRCTFCIVTVARGDSRSRPLDAVVAQVRHLAELEADFRARMLGRSVEVLWESNESFGDGRRWSGLTGNYVRVLTDTEANADLRNQTTTTELVESLPGALYGRCAATHGPLYEAHPMAQLAFH